MADLSRWNYSIFFHNGRDRSGSLDLGHNGKFDAVAAIGIDAENRQNVPRHGFVGPLAGFTMPEKHIDNGGKVGHREHLSVIVLAPGATGNKGTNK